MKLEVEPSEIISCLYDYLSTQTQGVGEHVLIQHLTQAELFAPLAGQSPSLSLFKKHFLTMHSLYSLQKRLAGGEYTLIVSPLNVQLIPSADYSNDSTRVGIESHTLSEYYLDLTHLAEATEDSVEDLLNSFWKRFAQWQLGDTAFSVLGLKPDSTWNQIQKAYRRKAQLEHPDKGGNAEKFAEYTEAYQQLKAKFGN